MDGRGTASQLHAQAAHEVLGAKVLKDIEREEGTLESVLRELRALHSSQSSKTGIPALDTLIPTNIKTTTIAGRHLPLLYHLLHHLIRTLQGTVCLLDVTSTFSPSHLCLSRDELKHIHVFFPTKSSLAATLNGLEEYLLYDEGSKESRSREWVATIVLGGFGGDFAFGWKGVLRVQADEDTSENRLGAAISVEEAVTEKRRRDTASLVTNNETQGELTKKWRVVGENGSYSWTTDHDGDDS